jgi:hypothetical protein
MSDNEPFPGSPDDMMDTIAALRARVAKLEAALTKIRDNDPDGWEAAIARTALQ